MSTVPSTTHRRPGNFAAVVARLSRVNLIVILSAVVTGPITARVLGIRGRGELAAITAVLTMTPWLLDLGLSGWLARERARGGRLPEILGAALPVALAFSLVGVAAAIPVSHALGHGRPVVIAFLQIGLFLAPLTVALQSLLGLAIGGSHWRLLSASQILASVVPLIGIVLLALGGELSVGSAATVYLGASLVSLATLLPVVRGVRGLAFSRARSRAAAAFGAKSWLGTVAASGNARLDQVLMAGLASSRELGLYAVAVSIASLTTGLSIPVSNALCPRVAEGGAALGARSCRVTICLVAIAALAVGLVSAPMIPFVFGAGFADAVPMAVVLLLASIPLSGAIVLTTALTSADDPAASMRAEVAGLALTVPALVVLLPAYGGIGASFVSLVAYSARLAVLLRSARRVFGGTWRSFLVPTRSDLGWISEHARSRRATAPGA